jgi:Uri superfamily endonuclease
VNEGGIVRPGCYHLVIRLRRATELSVGRFGDWRLPAGWYVYTGSARRGLEARIARHLRSEKRLHWHVDYLLASPDASVVEAVRHWGGSFGECELNQAIEHLPGAQVPVPGFGASDCRAGCPAHLFYFKQRPVPQRETHHA